MELTIGERLRNEREKKKISLENISQHTKIVTRYLKALEDEDFTVFPAEVYLRGCLRNYAQYLGLDAEELLRIYVTQYEIKKGEIPPTTKKRPKVKRLFLFTILAAGGIIILLGWELSSYLGSRPVSQDTVPIPITTPTPVEVIITPETTTPVPAPVVLESLATAEVWIQVTIDDKDIINETLHPGDKRTWEAQDNIKLWVGNAGGLELKFNGTSLGPLGKPGQVRSNLTFFPDRALL